MAPKVSLIPCIFYLVLLVAAASCRWGEKTFIPVCFPESSEGLPESCLDSEAWNLLYWDGTGELQTWGVSFSEGRRVSLEVMKESPVLCLIVPPDMAPQFQFRPAGGLFVPGEPVILEMNWLDGAGTDFLLRSAEGGLDLTSLNLRRFSQEMQTRGAPDPWGLDWDLLGRQLGEKNMRSWYIRKKFQYELEILFPPGEWIPRSFWMDPVRASGIDTISLDLYEGNHAFYNESTAAVFVITVDGEGESFTVLYES